MYLYRSRLDESTDGYSGHVNVEFGEFCGQTRKLHKSCTTFGWVFSFPLWHMKEQLFLDNLGKQVLHRWSKYNLSSHWSFKIPWESLSKTFLNDSHGILNDQLPCLASSIKSKKTIIIVLEGQPFGQQWQHQRRELGNSRWSLRASNPKLFLAWRVEDYRQEHQYVQVE